jgi:uncharacterized protein (DUF1501 family)
MNRREFLKVSSVLATAALSSKVYALPAPSRQRFLLVFLRGGYDAANLLVPYTSDFYYQVRPSIAVARPGAVNGQGALELDSHWGLHPALKDTVLPLYGQGQCLFLPFAGTNDLTRSHFETQDTIEMGQPEAGTRHYDSGFLNRLVSVLGGRIGGGMSFTSQLPIVFKGEQPVGNMALRGGLRDVFSGQEAQVLASMYAGTPLAQPVREGLSLKQEVAKAFEAEMQQANRGAIGAKGFEQEARRVARMMRDNPHAAIGFIDVGGWDTHVNEGGAQGALANQLDNLGSGLAAYVQEMGPAWRDTVVVVLSEFGRTFRENGDRGTDHGHGSVYWVLGGAVRGGQIAGRQIDVNERSLFQNRDYPVLNEYRSVLGYIFKRCYGLDRNQLQYVFAGAEPGDYTFL